MAAVVQLCTVEDCAKLLSQYAIDLRTDDDPTKVDDAIDEGSAYVCGLLAAYYEPADIAQNPLMVKIARFFSCCNICQFRGEAIPAGWEDKRDKYDEILMKYATGALKLFDVSQAPGGPAVSNTEYNLEGYPAAGVSRPRSSDRTNPVERDYSNAFPYRPGTGR